MKVISKVVGSLKASSNNNEYSWIVPRVILYKAKNDILLVNLPFRVCTVVKLSKIAQNDHKTRVPNFSSSKEKHHLDSKNKIFFNLKGNISSLVSV